MNQLEMETLDASHSAYDDLAHAGVFVQSAKSTVVTQRWDSALSHIDKAIERLHSAREKVAAIRKKHGIQEEQ